jgi:hypothetical protein
VQSLIFDPSCVLWLTLFSDNLFLLLGDEVALLGITEPGIAGAGERHHTAYCLRDEILFFLRRESPTAWALAA